MAFVIQGKAHYVEEDEKTVITKVDIEILEKILDLNLNFLGFPWVFPSWSPAAGARQAMDWAGTH